MGTFHTSMKAGDASQDYADYLNDAWVAEPKIDGVRVRITFDSEAGVRVHTEEYAYNKHFPQFDALNAFPELDGTVLDGELTWQGGMATPLLNASAPKAWAMQKATAGAVFHAFDVVEVKGDDVRDQPYGIRRELLEVVVKHLASAHVWQVPQMEASEYSYRQAVADGYEGLMLKKRSSKYVEGRSSQWQKIKHTSTGDFFICGSKPGKGKNSGKVGSLKVGYLSEDKKVVYCGDVRGFSDAFCDEVTGPDGEVAFDWVGRVIEVRAQEVTKGGRLRHPRFVRVRSDKTMGQCGPEQIEVFKR